MVDSMPKTSQTIAHTCDYMFISENKAVKTRFLFFVSIVQLLYTVLHVSNIKLDYPPDFQESDGGDNT